MSDQLSHDRPSRPPPHSHKNTIVWQFLQAVRPGDGELGVVLRRLRDRVDMPRHFPHRTALVEYMHKCRLESALVARNAIHIYAMYSEFYQQVLHPRDDSAVNFVSPSQLVRSGVSREQLARTILSGLGLFSDPDQNFAEGGKWTDSAYASADAVIQLLTSKGGE